MAEIVETTTGKVAGSERRGIRRYSGIPYAQAPRGDLRFRAPEPATPWGGVREALLPGPSAPQMGPTGPLARLMPTGRRSEDCLSLNVWTPAPDGARRPVMVWIHGGAFVMGSGSTSFYSGRRLARAGDVVVVTLNYRLGVLGFLQMADLTGADGPIDTNLGIRDQIAALRWVRDNIAGFGGNPDDVTIFGESAGAMSVGTLLGTPSARGLFHKAILQSGAAFNVSSRAQAARAASAFLSELDLTSATAHRLREFRTSQLLEAQTRATIRLGFAHGVMPWQPAVDGDLLPQPAEEAIAAGCSKDVPVIVGANREEWKLFLLGDRRSRSMDEAALGRRMGRSLPGHDDDGQPFAERAFEVYQGRRAGRRAKPRERWAEFQGDRVFHWPAARLLARQSRNQADTYAYRFDWAPPLLRRPVGACHALEIPLVFGTWRQPAARALYGGGAALRQLGERMQTAWVRFARTGRPGHDDLPDWPAWNERDRSTLVFDRSPRATSGADASAHALFEDWHRTQPS